jgi:hypothetical protein
MTIPRLEAITKRWEVIPPLSVIVAKLAAAYGVTFDKPAPAENNLQELVDMLGSAGLSTEKPAWLTT